MGKINGCLKCLFIFFNMVFLIIGCLLIFAAVKSTVYSAQLSAAGGPSLTWIWVFAIGFLVVSSLGIYAGFSENPLALKVFAGFMGFGMVIMMIIGIVIVVMRNKIKEAFDSSLAQTAKSYIEDKDLRGILEGLQESAGCCGVVNAKDWGDTIPDSCQCQSPSSPVGCKPRPEGTRGPERIYQESCGDVIFDIINLLFKVFMAFFFAFAVIALLGLLISLLMLHQVKTRDATGGAFVAMKGY
ncbi:tetraspanin-8-like [Mastacembelus armatus]|uniref:Tetraspanin n=1 Tax=Mastacembelus armatus TaxID=205130 RepID=A0A3Q3MZM4_9TELE|nr:tetraspanin-8-like [Mastacembelus armatus]